MAENLNVLPHFLFAIHPLGDAVRCAEPVEVSGVELAEGKIAKRGKLLYRMLV